MNINRRSILGGLAAIATTTHPGRPAKASGHPTAAESPPAASGRRETPYEKFRRLSQETATALDELNASSRFEPYALMIYPADHGGYRVVHMERVAYPRPDQWRQIGGLSA